MAKKHRADKVFHKLSSLKKLSLYGQVDAPKALRFFSLNVRWHIEYESSNIMTI